MKERKSARNGQFDSSTNSLDSWYGCYKLSKFGNSTCGDGDFYLLNFFFFVVVVVAAQPHIIVICITIHIFLHLCLIHFFFFSSLLPFFVTPTISSTTTTTPFTGNFLTVCYHPRPTFTTQILMSFRLLS